MTTESLSRAFLAKVSVRDNTANFQIWRVFGGRWQSAEIKNIRAGEEVAGAVTLKSSGSDQTITVHTGAVPG